jgi:hypothetical protein
MLFPCQVEPLCMKMYTEKETKTHLFGHGIAAVLPIGQKFRDISRLIANVFFCFISKFLCFPRFLAEPWPGNTGLDCALRDPGFQSRRGQEGFLFSKASRPAMEPTQPPVQWIMGVFPGVMRPGHHLVPRLRKSGAVPLFLRCEDRKS